ncbi:MAG: alpha-L-rhamnosidase N-terminal domain-containing protein [Parabacteroides merdae]
MDRRNWLLRMIAGKQRPALYCISTIFTGEEYDARLELDGWNRNGYKDSSWKNPLLVRAPKGSLHVQLAFHEKIIRILQPVS